MAIIDIDFEMANQTKILLLSILLLQTSKSHY